jgi:hypothetical protein
LKTALRAVSQRLSGSPPASRCGVRSVAKARSEARKSMKSAYQSSERISAVSRCLPLASNQSIVARKSRRVAGSNSAAS